MRAEERSSWPVVLAEDGAVDVVEAVAWNEAVPAGGTGEALWARERERDHLLYILPKCFVVYCRTLWSCQ